MGFPAVGGDVGGFASGVGRGCGEVVAGGACVTVTHKVFDRARSKLYFVVGAVAQICRGVDGERAA